VGISAYNGPMNTDTVFEPVSIWSAETQDFSVLDLMETLVYDAALKAYEDSDARYAADVADWYENGDGRSPEWIPDPVRGEGHFMNVGGLGYRYPACPHGTSLWTDYDNICGGCEDPHDNYEIAKQVALGAVSQWKRRCAGQKALLDSIGFDDPPEGLAEWAAKPVTKWLGEPQF
jgi:hypothetical protein